MYGDMIEFQDDKGSMVVFKVVFKMTASVVD